MKFYRDILVFLVIVGFAAFAYALPIHVVYPAGSAIAGTDYPLPVFTNMMHSGIIGTQSISLAGTAIKVGTLTALTRQITITAVTGNIEIGDATLTTGGGKGELLISGSTKTINVSTMTPLIYLVDVATDSTALIAHWY